MESPKTESTNNIADSDLKTKVVEITPTKEQDKTNSKLTEETAKNGPTEAEWQESYKQIVLEAQTYIELCIKGTMSKERFESVIGVLNMYADQVPEKDKSDSKKLASVIAANELDKVKNMYTQLGREDFSELHESAKSIFFD